MREKAVFLSCGNPECEEQQFFRTSTFSMAEIVARKAGWKFSGRGSAREHYCCEDCRQEVAEDEG